MEPSGVLEALERRAYVVHEELVGQARAAAGDERLDALGDGELADLLAAAFDSPDLASPLVEDTVHLRNALADHAVFRERFAARCTWRPDAVGAQLSIRDLTERVARARPAWPELARKLDRYAERLTRQAAVVG